MSKMLFAMATIALLAVLPDIVVAQDSSEPPPSKEQMDQYTKATEASKPLVGRAACFETCSTKLQTCMAAPKGAAAGTAALARQCQRTWNACKAHCR